MPAPYSSKQALGALGLSLTQELIRNSKSQGSPHTYWIRLCILTACPDDSHAHETLKGIDLEHVSS